MAEALAELVAHGERALAATTDQLDILRQAGVVDAGGAGVLEVLRGIAAHVRGEPLPELEAVSGGIPLEAVHQELSRYRYCTSFFVEGETVDPEELERELTKLGDSLLVVGGPGAVKVHVHTDEPGAALALATERGVIEEVDIKNMHVQTADRTQRLEREAGVTGAVAVVLGDGNRRLFESLGASTVEGGETMNPSTADLLAAVEALPEQGVVLLPNSKNVVLAAEQAAEQSGKDVRVIPTRSLQAGLGALVAFDIGRPLDENVAEMEEAAAAVRAGSVARASRSAKVGDVDVAEGEFLGLVDGEPVASGETLEPVATDVVARLVGDGADVLTVLVGDGAGESDGVVDAIRAAHPASRSRCTRAASRITPFFSRSNDPILTGMEGQPIDVVLVEDNDTFRQALELMLGLTPDVRVVAAVADGESALSVCPGLQPDVVLVDYRLPGLDGVETTTALRAALPKTAVVVLTAAAEHEEIQALYDAGAVACLTKDRGVEEIVGAIREAAGRGAPIG